MDSVSYLTVDVDGMRVIVTIHGDPTSAGLRERLNRKFAGSSWSPVPTFAAHARKPDFAALAASHRSGNRVQHRSIMEKRPYG